MLDCFKKDYSKPSKPYGSHGEGELFKPKWGIIIPHLKRAQGAQTPDGKWTEYNYAQAMLEPAIGGFYRPFATRDEGGVYGAAKTLKEKFSVTATCEPHLNAYSGTVDGYEILCLKGDNLSCDLAQNILDAFAQKFPRRKLRGLKEMKPGQRGAKNLIDSKRAGMDAALLSEMFFIDNPKAFIEPDVMAKFWDEVLV